MVRQELECSPLKWDTVVIYANPLGIQDSKFKVQSFQIYPVPADEMLNVKLEMLNEGVAEKSCQLRIYNSLGQIVREEEIVFKNKAAVIKTGDLENGVYHLKLIYDNLQTVSNRFVISR